MKRIPEPELMESYEQAKAYSEADFQGPHSMFVQLFVERFGADLKGHVLDAGCGPADIAVRFANAYSHCTVHGVDASEAMISFGRKRVVSAGLEGRVLLYQGYLPGIILPVERFQALIVNSLLHHMPDPMKMWEVVKQYAPAGSGTRIFIMDLIRPSSRQEAAQLVESYSGSEPEVLKRDFYNSLLAAFRPDEVRGQLEESGLGFLQVEVVSDRHLAVWGIME